MSESIIKRYLKRFGLNKLEIQVFISLFKLWVQPASKIANNISVERTKVYRALIWLSKKWLITITHKNKIKYFFISWLYVIKNKIQEDLNNISSLNNDFENFREELNKINHIEFNLPEISIYSSIAEVENLYDDIYTKVHTSNLMEIQYFSSMILDNYWKANSLSKEITYNFLQKLRKENIHINIIIWVWNLVLESFLKTTISNLDKINMDLNNSNLNIFLVWDTIYFMSLYPNVFWLKITSKEFVGLLSVLFKNIN